MQSNLTKIVEFTGKISIHRNGVEITKKNSRLK